MAGRVWDFPLRMAGFLWWVPSPTSLTPDTSAEGQIAYVESTNTIWRYSGTAWAEINTGGGGTFSVTAPLVYAGGVLSLPQASAVQSGYLSSYDYAQFIANGTKVKVTASDTTPNYLLYKLGAGSGLSITLVSPGGSEVMSITNTDRGTVARAAHEAAYQHGNIPSTPSSPTDDGKVWTANGGVGSWQTPSGGGGSSDFNTIVTHTNGPDGLPLTLNGMTAGPFIVCDESGNVVSMG